MQRRHFLMAGGAGTLASLLQACGGGSDADGPGALAAASDDGRAYALAATPARVIIVGGGMAGVALAKYLRLWGAGAVNVTLVERDTAYTSNIMSSLVLTGQRTLASLRFTYDALRTKYGVTVVTGEVVAVDPVAARVTLANGSVLQGDRVVLAPGLDFDPIPGLTNPDLMPHAWKAGPQTTLLAQQLSAMPAGGVVIMAIPKAPYRCPPGPYERACLIADWLRQRKRGSKLIVLDANPTFVIEADNFGRAFTQLHGSVIEYHTNVAISSVDTSTRTVFTNLGAYTGSVVSLIPPQRAPALLARAGLLNSADGHFAVVNTLSYAHTAAPLIHVLGDAASTGMPKAGHIANQEAKVCADALIRIFAGGAPDPAPVTNSACYSTITMTQASWLTAGYQYDPVLRAMSVVPASFAASAGWDASNFSQMNTWFRAVMADTFA